MAPAFARRGRAREQRRTLLASVPTFPRRCDEEGAKDVGRMCPPEAAGIGRAVMSAADTAWMLVATALVLLMTPALGFFYGGLVRAKNALNTLMMSVCALGVVGLGWALVVCSIAFPAGNGVIGVLSSAL